jgi:hypothetical protein
MNLSRADQFRQPHADAIAPILKHFASIWRNLACDCLSDNGLERYLCDRH